MSLNVFIDHNTREHLMPSDRVFHSVAAAVSINRLSSFTVLLLHDVVFADLRCPVGWCQINSSHRNLGASL